MADQPTLFPGRRQYSFAPGFASVHHPDRPQDRAQPERQVRGLEILDQAVATIEGYKLGSPAEETTTLGPGSIIFEDPPAHDVHRSVLSRVFTPKKMAAIEPKVREFCARSLDP